MKVLMLPQDEGQGTSGIAQVIRAYKRYLPEFGIELVGEDAASYDLLACHVDSQGRELSVLHNHGLHWTADYACDEWQYRVNAGVIDAIRHAKEVTVPSAWVAETFQRDMRFTPHVVPHGIGWDEWQGSERGNYVLWNKNRAADVCDVAPMGWLAKKFPDVRFVSTFPPDGAGANVTVTGVQPHRKMKRLIQGAGVYLATTKETFGIGILEAMASGVPVLGYAHGGILDLVQHGVNGYLAGPDNLEDLAEGLVYCLSHAEVLGENGRELAKRWTWQAACEKVAQVYQLALAEEPPTVAIVIPSYMYGDLVRRAVESAINQTYSGITDIIVVDDGSTDEGATENVVMGLSEGNQRLHYLRQENAGVAVARNRGISEASSKYVCCLDADDAIEPEFIEKCVATLEADPSLGVAYTGLKLRLTDGRIVPGRWPNECDFDRHLMGDNQVPTCCVFRREAWERLGGYRQRYAPHGCGTEDAEFWLRMGAYGWGIRQVTTEPLFIYSMGGRTMSTSDYKEVDWRVWHPWAQDLKHPFASIATPRNKSHEVRQYDEPVVSVIIPVGPGHEKDVINALDSLEAQTFRKWEAILVWDIPTCDTSKLPKVVYKQEVQQLQTVYSYAKFIFPHTLAARENEKFPDQSYGAGYARNRGVEIARAPYLFFLDADDWLFPQALELLLLSQLENGDEVGVYSDHVGLAIIQNVKYLKSLQQAGRLVEHDEDGHTVVRHFTKEYNREEALRQPDLKVPYLWCNISTLIPTAWHYEIGGFDEAMWSWEDWDYWIRLARQGKDFVRVPEPLLVYRYYSGNRREDGKGIAPEMAAYMREKYRLM